MKTSAKHFRPAQGFPTFFLPCTPSAFQQISMYPFSILTDEHEPLKSRMQKYFIMIVHRFLSWLFIYFYHDYSYIHRYMYEYFKI